MSAFNRFVGNKGTVERLDSMLLSGRVPHAFIIEGAVGTGRRTLANMLARALACTGENKPCGECTCCLMSENPDIVTVLPEKANITVDKIRKIREEAYILPNQSDKRVFIIPDANLMNEQAQNALLKVFEEPPKRVAFILTCEYANQLLATVRSRAVVLKLSSVQKDAAVKYILEQNSEFNSAEVELAVADEDGNIGRALIRLSGEDKADFTAREILSCIGERSELALMKSLLVIEKDRIFAKSVLSAMSVLVSEALAVKMGAPKSYAPDDIRTLLAEKFTRHHLIGISEVCLSARKDCDANGNGALMVTNLCACIRAQIDL